MLRMTVVRRPSQGGATLGELLVDGQHVCYTLEDEVRERPDLPVSQWKIKGITAIPAGVYEVVSQFSPHFGENTLTLLNVPGFEFIRMHAGNTSADTEGCLLLGMQVTDTTIVGGTSRPALALVRNLVCDAWARGERTFIDIQNARAFA